MILCHGYSKSRRRISHGWTRINTDGFRAFQKNVDRTERV
jgi:hypothetical protein